METAPEILRTRKTVNVTIETVGTGIRISVDPEPLLLDIDENYLIEWVLTQALMPTDWDFDVAAGINVRNKKRKFDTPQWSAKKYSWKHEAVDKGDFTYTITLTDGDSTYTLDPTIRNQ